MTPPLDYRAAYTRYLEACRDFPDMTHEPPAEVPGEDCYRIRLQVHDELVRSDPDMTFPPNMKRSYALQGLLHDLGKPL